MKSLGWLAIYLLFLTLPSTATGAVEKRFLRRDGSQLLMAGVPFRAVGVNKHELLDMYVADLLGHDLDASLTSARRSLDALEALGVDVIRVRGSQYWPAQIEKTYLGGDGMRRRNLPMNLSSDLPSIRRPQMFSERPRLRPGSGRNHRL